MRGSVLVHVEPALRHSVQVSCSLRGLDSSAARQRSFLFLHRSQLTPIRFRFSSGTILRLRLLAGFTGRRGAGAKDSTGVRFRPDMMSLNARCQG